MISKYNISYYGSILIFFYQIILFYFKYEQSTATMDRSKILKMLHPKTSLSLHFLGRGVNK